MRQFVVSLFDFFLPRFCHSCKTKLSPEENIVCADCLSKINRPDPEILSSEYQRKFADKKIIADFTSLFIFEKEKELQHIIHSLKYQNRFLNGKFLGSLIGHELIEKIESWKIDYIVPIPLHHLKKADRGYNQSFYIAKGIAKAVRINLKPNLAKRKKFTRSQTIMTLLEREENIRNAFKVKNKKKIKGKNILLVDDVITTGATISGLGREFKEAGANKVFAISVAIAE